MTRQEVYEELLALTKRNNGSIRYDADGAIIKRDHGQSVGVCYTAEELATLFSKGHERWCHEQLVARLDETSFMSAGKPLREAFAASKQALAESEGQDV